MKNEELEWISVQERLPDPPRDEQGRTERRNT